MPYLPWADYARGRVNVQSGPAPFFGSRWPIVPRNGAGIDIPGPVGYVAVGAGEPSPGLDSYAESVYRRWGSNRIPASLAQLLSRFAPLNMAIHTGLTG